MALGVGISTLLPVMDCSVVHTALRTCCSSETWASRVATLCVSAATSKLSLLSERVGDDSVLPVSFCWNWVAAVVVVVAPVNDAVSGSDTVMADSDRVLGSAVFWG